MARRSLKLLRFENTLYKYDSINQSWNIDHTKMNADNDLFDIGTHATCKHMSQKVTPTKLRRGFLNTWPLNTFVDYKNKLTNLENVFFFQRFSNEYLASILNNLGIFFEKIEIQKINETFYFNVFYFEPKLTSRRDVTINQNRMRSFQARGLIVDHKANPELNPFFIEENIKNTGRPIFKLNLEKLSVYIENQLKKFFKKELKVSFKQQNNPGANADLLARMLTDEVEKSNANFKKALRNTLKEMKFKSNIKGIRVNCSGRLGKAPMAKTEWFKFGQIPLNTISALVQYADSVAFTKYGSIGIKVWVYYHDK